MALTMHYFSCPLNAATSAVLTLPAMLDDSTITTVCIAIGGLSTTRLRADFAVNFERGASFIILTMDSPSLTFRKNYSGQTITYHD